MRWDGSNLYLMGIPAPTSPVLSTLQGNQTAPRDSEEGSLLNGRYYSYRYTYYNKDQNIESDPSPESAAFFTHPDLATAATTTDDNKEVQLVIPRNSDPQVTHYRLYRSEPLNTATGDTPQYSSNKGAVFFFVAEIDANKQPNPMSIGTTGDTPLTDTWWEGVPESALGPGMPTRNAPPPKDPEFITYWRGRTWVAKTTDHPSYVHFSEAGLPDYYDQNNFIDMDDGDGQAVTGMVPLFNQLLVFKQNSMFAITEDGGVSSSTVFFPFSKVKTHTNVGASSHYAAQKLDENAVVFLSQKGVYITDGFRIDYLSGKVENIFRDEISRAVLSDAVATVHKKRNQYILCLSTDGTDNDIALVYDYVRKTWTRYNIHARTITQTEDVNGVERVFTGGVCGQGYVGRWDNGDTDGAEIVLPAGSTEPDELVSAPTGGSTTTLINTAANWASVAGDGLRGLRFKLTQSGTTTNHVVADGDTTTLTFYPPAGATVGTSDTYIIAGIDGTWRSKPFDFGSLSNLKALQDLEVFQTIQSTSSDTAALQVALALEDGTFQVNNTTVDISSSGSYKTLIPFKGIGWRTGNGTSRGYLIQIRLRNQDPDEPFTINDLVFRLEPSDR
jgi:hypothetical protein